MPQDSWVSCRQELDELISLLLAEPDYIVTDLVEEYDDMAEREPEVKDGKTQKVKVAGSVVGLVENLDNEVSLAKCAGEWPADMQFIKTLQHTDAHDKGSDYIERLREELPLYTTIVKAQVLFERDAASDAVARTVMRRLDHIYAKVSQDHERVTPQLTCSPTQSLTTLKPPSTRPSPT